MVAIILTSMAVTMILLVILSIAEAAKKALTSGENQLKIFRRHLRQRSQTRRAVHSNQSFEYHY